MPKTTEKKSHPSHWPEAALSASSEATAATLPNKDTKPGQKRGNPVPWQKDHGLTDSLLGLIEDKPVCLTICGFAGGSSKADGQDLIEHCQVMGDLLLICHESSWWASKDKQTAGLAVKNWINWLKKNYMHYRSLMLETGQSLTDKDTMADDMELKNLWDTKIKPYFPWYY